MGSFLRFLLNRFIGHFSCLSKLCVGVNGSKPIQQYLCTQIYMDVTPNGCLCICTFYIRIRVSKCVLSFSWMGVCVCGPGEFAMFINTVIWINNSNEMYRFLRLILIYLGSGNMIFLLARAAGVHLDFSIAIK